MSKLFVPEYPNFFLEEYLDERGKEFQVHESGDHAEIAINCPECHLRGEPTVDTKKKLWLNPEKGTFVCYRCGFTGGVLRLVQSLSQVSFTQAIRLVRGKALDPLEHLELRLYDPDLKIKMHEEDIALKELELPYGYQPIDGPHPYLEERGIPWQYAMKHDWGFSTAGYTKNRIIVPTYMDNRMVFWQARATWDVAKDEKKVLNPTGASARHVLFNFDVAREYEQIVIVEGFIDSVKTGPNAVATNGKKLHPQQLLWLEKSKAKEIVLMWDNDAWTDGRTVKGVKKPSSIEAAVSLLKTATFKVRVAKLPEGRDPGSFKYRSPVLKRLINESKEM